MTMKSAGVVALLGVKSPSVFELTEHVFMAFSIAVCGISAFRFVSGKPRDSGMTRTAI
ncbi:hypothetical protein GGQ73_003371 [Rhizobium skierniewicense]|uniref:Uncharacterized protein n=1 Tax=Rhizobium skierniewicense TaxID=984260 RepID=A0A7W6G3D5_9HYPH|nr:hypothetical protein [Rhizobium skierniewicense]